jgi:iron complex outermembrane receptor protein
MLFGKIAQGFKSGGFNQQRTTGGLNTQFDDEKATDFEVGARTSWFEGMLNANATFFYTLYDDFQAQAFDGTGFSVTNAGSLTSYGVEADAFAVPHEAWQIGGSIGWNVAEYDKFKNSPCTIDQIFAARVAAGPAGVVGAPCDQDLAGERLDNAPRWTASLFTQVEYPLGGLSLWGRPLLGRFRTDYSYRDFVFLQQDLDPNITQGPVHLLNFLVAVGPEDGPWELSVWTRNAIDFRYLVAGVDVPITSGYGGLNGPPRQFGATLRLFF